MPLPNLVLLQAKHAPYAKYEYAATQSKMRPRAAPLARHNTIYVVPTRGEAFRLGSTGNYSVLLRALEHGPEARPPPALPKLQAGEGCFCSGCTCCRQPSLRALTVR